MPKNSLSKYHYLLTKLMLILAAVIAMASFLMAGLHYQGLVRTKIQFFDETLYSLKHTYIYELIRESERQLQALCASLDVDAIQRGESAFNTTWPIVHQIKMEDKHYIYFYNAKTQ
ncbi:GGDEF domain-containing protein, partial [Vibrio sp. V38_P2S17PM301]|nr:GGDEF domain-containing protein [Vibrio sp. V38_P2S17PM301]